MLSMGVTGGLIALAAALLAATALGVGLRRRAGRFRPGPAGNPAPPSRAETGALTEADLGSSLGRQATRQGRVVDALALLTEAKEHFAAIGSGYFVLETEARLAELVVLGGSPEEASSGGSLGKSAIRARASGPRSRS